jgi:hypothetical protein
MQLRAWVGVLTILGVACGSSGPTSPGGTTEGTYSGTHRFTVTLSTPPPLSIDCAGSLVIIDVANGTFNGTITINACAPIIQQTVTGTISGSIASGQIAFTSPQQDQLIDLIQAEGCTVQRIDPNFAGTIQSGSIDAVLTATVLCEDQGTVELGWRVLMQQAL